MRYVLALLGAVAITVAIFLFMQGLIESRQQQDVVLPLHTLVEVPPPEREEEEPEPEEEPPEEPLEEPIMEALQVAPPTPEPAPELEIAALDLGVGDIKIQSAGDRWNGPVGRAGIAVAAGGGEDAQGYIEVIPFDTRKPNVPDVAWENKISGGVLVEFRVTAEGTTSDVRVLDANPRGVFEEKVVAAVSDWKYRVNFYGGATGSVVLTQKVEVQWENYPQNMPNVD